MTEVEFESKIKNPKRNWLIFFQSPECESCAQVSSTVEKLAQANKGSKTFFAKVNCEQEKELCDKRLGLDRKKPNVILFYGADSTMATFNGKDFGGLQTFIEASNSKVAIPSPVDNTPTIMNFLIDHPYISVGVVTLFCVAVCGIFLAIICMSDDAPETEKKKTEAKQDETSDHNKEENEEEEETTSSSANTGGNLKERKPRTNDESTR